MAKRKPKTKKQVATLKHGDASRKNIPTVEYEAMMAAGDKTPIQVAYERRNRDLDPQLVWRGKDLQDWSDLVVQACPLYIQEKVHPKVLIDDLLRQSESDKKAEDSQLDLFADFNGLPDESAKTEFYQHDANWSNRMILGDSLQVMASLAEREGLRGQIQCIYLDPPYGASRTSSNTRSLSRDKPFFEKSFSNMTPQYSIAPNFHNTFNLAEGIVDSQNGQMDQERETAHNLQVLNEECLEKALSEVGKLALTSGTDNQREVCVFLYRRILELTNAILIIHNSGKCCAGIPVLLRSVLETFADLTILIEQPDHLQSMVAASLNQQLKFGKSVISGPENPFLQCLQSEEEFMPHFDHLQEEIKRLESNGHKPLKICEKFNKAGMCDEYDSIFRLFCCDTHTDLGSLSKWYSTNSDIHPTTALRTCNPVDTIPDLALSAGIIIRSSQKLHSFFSTGVLFDEFMTRLETIVAGCCHLQ